MRASVSCIKKVVYPSYSKIGCRRRCKPELINRISGNVVIKSVRSKEADKVVGYTKAARCYYYESDYAYIYEMFKLHNRL